jgi:CHAT domain-containing protein
VADQLVNSRNDCPDLELIAAYLDGRMTEGERSAIADHLGVCEDCYFVFTESARRQSHRQAPRAGDVPIWRRFSIPAAAGLATAAALVVIIQSGVLQRVRPSSGADVAELVAAVGAQRVIEPRLTGGFAYGEVRAPIRAGTGTAAVVSPDVRIAAAKLEKRVMEHRSADALGSLGIAYLVTGDVDKAVPVLEEAADQSRPASRVLSDLGAAYLARATIHDRLEDVAKSLALSERALKADSGLSEARFNRALALERLSLTDQAREAWQEYLKADPNSGWAAEARRHLSALTQSPQSHAIDDERRRVDAVARSQDLGAVLTIAKQAPHATREWVEDQLLVTWPALVLEGRASEARDLATRLAPLSGALAQERDDAFCRDAVSSVIAASQDPARVQALARAHRLYRSAQRDYLDDRIAESAKLFREAHDPLQRAQSPFAAHARLYLAIASYVSSDLTRASTELGHLAAFAQERHYTRLRGLIHRMSGLIHGVRGEFAEALDEYQKALECFRAVGDAENEAGIHPAMVEMLDFVGERDQAWKELELGLSQLALVRDFRRRHNILQLASLLSLRSGLPEVALQFQQATLGNALRWGRSPAIVNGYVYRAAIHEQLGDIELAAADLEGARRALAGISDPNLAARDTALIQLAVGEIELKRRPAEAQQALAGALSFFERTGANWPLARVYLARGRARLAAGDLERAEGDFLKGIEVFERMRASQSTEALRSSYSEQPWDLFGEMIRLQAVRRLRAERALAFAERARARTLLEAISTQAAAAPVDPSSARQNLPEGVTVLYFSSLDERLLVWVLTRASMSYVDVPIRQSDLVRLIELYRSSIGTVASAERDTESLMALYDALIRPVRGKLADRTRIVVVPDGILHAVPFAALIRREDRRYLVEDHPLAITPSMTIFQSSMDRKLRVPQWAQASALVVGNPRAGVPGAGVTADLPGAEEEARDVAAMYRDADMLLGNDATKARFLAAASAHDVVHFAGHALSNAEFPGLSRLLLSGSGETSRSLFAHEIAAHQFERTQLVVLAGCRTSAGRIRRGEGVFSLARPFIAAGVPTVVASLWDIDDRASRHFFVTFHRALRRGEGVADALRSAQLAAISESDRVLKDPANWSTFTVVGGVAALGPSITGISPALGNPSGVN